MRAISSLRPWRKDCTIASPNWSMGGRPPDVPERMPFMNNPAQKTLSSAQIEAFYHDDFVESQVRRYLELVQPALPEPRAVVDVGGGCGFFARALQARTGSPVRVLDSDATSVAACMAAGVSATLGDALAPPRRGDEDVVCFNLILHHLVGPNEHETRALQAKALMNWRGHAQAIFVDEYIYDSWVGNASGRMIYAVTSSRVLSSIARFISRWAPSLRANTFGVGVRFRAQGEWVQLFESLGLQVAAHARGPEETISAARRLLLIRSCRRDSFLLVSV
jgi:hypothetical protein